MIYKIKKKLNVLDFFFLNLTIIVNPLDIFTGIHIYSKYSYGKYEDIYNHDKIHM